MRQREAGPQLATNKRLTIPTNKSGVLGYYPHDGNICTVQPEIYNCCWSVS